MKRKLYATGGHGQTRPPTERMTEEESKKPVDPNAPTDDQEEQAE